MFIVFLKQFLFCIIAINTYVVNKIIKDIQMDNKCILTLVWMISIRFNCDFLYFSRKDVVIEFTIYIASPMRVGGHILVIIEWFHTFTQYNDTYIKYISHVIFLSFFQQNQNINQRPWPFRIYREWSLKIYFWLNKSIHWINTETMTIANWLLAQIKI